MKSNYILLSIFVIFLQGINSQICECPENQIYDQRSNSCFPGQPKQSDKSYQQGCESYKLNRYHEYSCQRCKKGYYQNNTIKGLACEETEINNCIEIYAYYVRNDQNTNHGSNNNEPPPPPFYSNQTNNNNQPQTPQYGCIQCDQGYFVKNYTCTSYPQQGEEGYIEGCISYIFEDKSNKCIKCNEENYCYYWKNQTCLKNPSTIKNCKQFEWNEYIQTVQCRTCEYQYYYNDFNNKCLPYNITVPGCLRYDFNDGKAECQYCDTSKALIRINGTYCGNYSEITPNCQYGEQMYSQYFCKFCKEGYYLKLGQCLPNPQENTKDYIQNCQYYEYFYYEDEVYCKFCEGLYVNNGRKCISPNPIVKNCAQYRYSIETETIQCDHCADNYTSYELPAKKCYQCFTGGRSPKFLSD